jgi:hypothetical protein
LVSALEKFEILVGMVIWHDILFYVNMVSKKLHEKIMCIDAIIKHIAGVISFSEKTASILVLTVPKPLHRI